MFRMLYSKTLRFFSTELSLRQYCSRNSFFLGVELWIFRISWGSCCPIPPVYLVLSKQQICFYQLLFFSLALPANMPSEPCHLVWLVGKDIKRTGPRTDPCTPLPLTSLTFTLSSEADPFFHSSCPSSRLWYLSMEARILWETVLKASQTFEVNTSHCSPLIHRKTDRYVPTALSKHRIKSSTVNHVNKSLYQYSLMKTAETMKAEKQLLRNCNLSLLDR